MSNLQEDHTQSWRASDAPLTELEIAFQKRQNRKTDTENISTTNQQQTEPEFTDSEPEGEEDSCIIEENKPMFTDSESEDEDSKSVPLTERSKKLPSSSSLKESSIKSPHTQAINFDRIMNNQSNNNESNASSGRMGTMALLANELFSDDEEDDEDVSEILPPQATIPPLPPSSIIHEPSQATTTTTIPPPLPPSSSIQSQVEVQPQQRPLTPMELHDEEIEQFLNDNDVQSHSPISSSSSSDVQVQETHEMSENEIDEEKEDEEEKENDKENNNLHYSHKFEVHEKTVRPFSPQQRNISNSPLSLSSKENSYSNSSNHLQFHDDKKETIQFEEEKEDWHYKEWVMNSLELVSEMNQDTRSYVEERVGEVSHVRKLCPLSTHSKVMLAEEKGKGEDLGMEGAATRFRRILIASDKQLGPLHPLSISAAADLGDCLIQLGGSGDWQEAEVVLRRVLRFREIQDTKEKKNKKMKDDINESSDNVISNQELTSEKDENKEDENKDDNDDSTMVVRAPQVTRPLWGDRAIVAGLALTELMKKMKRSEEAIELARHSVVSSETLFGKQHKQTLISMRSLATSLLLAAELCKDRVLTEKFASESESIFRDAATEEENMYGLNSENTKSCLSGVANSILTSPNTTESRFEEAMRLGVKISHVASVPPTPSTTASMKLKQKQLDLDNETKQALAEQNEMSTIQIFSSWLKTMVFPHPNSCTNRNTHALALATPIFMAVVGIKVNLDPLLWNNFQILTDVYDWVLANLVIVSATISLLVCFSLMTSLILQHVLSDSGSVLEKELIITILFLPPLLGMSSFIELIVIQPPIIKEEDILRSSIIDGIDISNGYPLSYSQLLSLLLESGTQVYEAIVVYQFLELMFCFTNVIRDKPVPSTLRGRPVHLLFPLNLYWPHLTFDEKLVKKLESWTRQYVFVKLIEVIVRSYFVNYLDYSFISYVCDGVLFISTTFAMGALVGFYHTYSVELAPHNPLQKFVAIKLVVLICSYQKWILSALVSFGFPNQSLSKLLTFFSPYLVQFGFLSPLPSILINNDNDDETIRCHLNPECSKGESFDSLEEVWDINWNVKDIPCLYANRQCDAHIAIHQVGSYLTVMESGFLFAIVFYFAFGVASLSQLEDSREGKKVLQRAASIASLRMKNNNRQTHNKINDDGDSEKSDEDKVHDYDDDNDDAVDNMSETTKENNTLQEVRNENRSITKEGKEEDAKEEEEVDVAI